MKFVRKQVLTGELFCGVWNNIGSTLTAEMAGLAGFDWVLFDLEHGSADYESLVPQLQALEGTGSAPIVRIAWNEPPRFKRVLDLGISGVMVPWVNNADEARQAARSMRYPPEGIRGVAYLNRATSFTTKFDEYFAAANDNLVTITQIETGEAVDNAAEIAAVDGVDVLFVGPLDLSVNLGIPKQFDHPRFKEALSKVVAAAKSKGKCAGILLAREEQLEETVDQGFTFVALGSDSGAVAAGFRKTMEAFRRYKK